MGTQQRNAVRAHQPPSRLWVYDHTAVTISQYAHINFVAQDPALMFGLTGDRSRMPEIAARRRNALHVQVEGDSERDFTGRIFKEDPADDVGTNGIDLPTTAKPPPLAL